ncbi:unnamed protein product [Caenorhabditis bovis]|uniref:glucuronosyltransferase n=1 Tax=Caenorhabditis bovis TaxID=2654633 RepID=A0A8S1F914_9PELO|nr:unnamed protein product [Caenorhabditis bovis]
MRILAIFCFLSAIRAVKIALFPSTGCFSHDVMMKEIGAQLDGPTTNITWIQTYLYEFGFGEIRLPDAWNRLALYGVDEKGEQLHEKTGKLVWRQNVPYDFQTPFQFDGIRSFIVMLQRHQEYCTKMLHDPRYQQLRYENITVAVLDHFLQECMGGLAHLLNASVVQFSNWPVADGYITSLNLPASPAAVPKTGTRLSSYSMTFLQRCQNLLFHIAIVFTRFVQMQTLDRMFARNGYPWIRVETNEAQRPIYAGRSELLLETIRPINYRVKHFGSASMKSPHHYVSSIGHLNSASPTTSTVVRRNASSPEDECIPTNVARRRSWLFDKVRNREQIEARRTMLRQKYATIDWNRVDREQFVLVSFGSVAQVTKMHQELLAHLLDTFSSQPGLIIWQSDLSGQQMRAKFNLTVPSNVMISGWVPIKELLAHENINYIICHGGINTVNELALFGVPVLGVPLQGDQISNLARIADLGAAELMTVHELDGLGAKMHEMRRNIERYWSRSEQLARMLQTHRELHKDYQRFWLNWVARNGKRIERRKFLRFEYLGDLENRLWAAIGVAIVAGLVTLYQ